MYITEGIERITGIAPSSDSTAKTISIYLLFLSRARGY